MLNLIKNKEEEKEKYENYMMNNKNEKMLFDYNRVNEFKSSKNTVTTMYEGGFSERESKSVGGSSSMLQGITDVIPEIISGVEGTSIVGVLGGMNRNIMSRMGRMPIVGGVVGKDKLHMRNKFK